MSTSRNMPARFKSRTHLKMKMHFRKNIRAKLVLELEITSYLRRSYQNRLRSLELLGGKTKYGLTSAKVIFGDAKHKLIVARAHRKSVVLPRLP